MGEVNNEVLTMISTTEANDSQLIKIIDGCANINEYKSIYKSCNDIYKEFNRLRKNHDIKIYMITETKINENINIKTIIRNYEPGIITLNTKSLEILSQIEAGGKSISTKGSGYYGGCNTSEYKEFLSILKDSIKYFNHI